VDCHCPHTQATIRPKQPALTTTNALTTGRNVEWPPTRPPLQAAQAPLDKKPPCCVPNNTKQWRRVTPPYTFLIFMTGARARTRVKLDHAIDRVEVVVVPVSTLRATEKRVML